MAMAINWLGRVLGLVCAAAAAGAWGGQRKMLRQMDVNPAAPGARY